MLGWKILVHAVRMVVRNIPSVFRIFWAPVLLSVLVIAAFVYVTGIADVLVWGERTTIPAENLPHFAFLLFFVIWIILAVIGAWGVTAWHRFVLLEEFSSGVLPEFDLKRAVGYFLRLLLLGLIALILFVPAIFVLSAIIQAVWPVGAVLFVAFALLLGVLLLRWSLILPAFAVGKSMTLSESWRAWDSIVNPGRTALGLIVCYAILQSIVSWVVFGLQFAPLVQAFASIAAQVFFAILNVSILTTLYGYIVEKRELS